MRLTWANILTIKLNTQGTKIHQGMLCAFKAWAPRLRAFNDIHCERKSMYDDTVWIAHARVLLKLLPNFNIGRRG